MARFRSRNALVPINRIKHVIDSSATLAGAAVSGFQLAITADSPTLSGTSEVMVGSKINGFYIRFEVASNEDTDLGAIPNVYFYVWKNTGGNLTRIAPNAVGSNDNKRFVIHQEMTMIENSVRGGNPRTIFNGVVVVPKGMRRMAPNDLWEVVILSPALNIAACMQAHYKEFR